MNFGLTREERKAIAAGDRTALKRDTKPDVEGGEQIVLASSRGGRQFVGRSEEERLANRGATIEIPTVPTLWIILKAPVLKERGWVVEFTVHDERRTQRRLAAVPQPPGDPGLRTRSGETVDAKGVARARKVAPKGTDPMPLSDEGARGYGGSGLTAVDELEAVDDATLSEFARRVNEENAMRQSHQRHEAAKLAAEAKVAEERRRGKPADLATAAAQRAAKRQRLAA